MRGQQPIASMSFSYSWGNDHGQPRTIWVVCFGSPPSRRCLGRAARVVHHRVIQHRYARESSTGTALVISSVYEFSALDPDRSYGQVDSFRTVDDAFQFACEQTGADPRKFVNAGVVQDEYRDAYLTENVTMSQVVGSLVIRHTGCCSTVSKSVERWRASSSKMTHRFINQACLSASFQQRAFSGRDVAHMAPRDRLYEARHLSGLGGRFTWWS